MNMRPGPDRFSCFPSFSSKCSGPTSNPSPTPWDGRTKGLRQRGSQFHHHTCCCSALKSHQMNGIISSSFSRRASLWCFFFLPRLLRETVLGIACQMNDEDALLQASSLFDQWINGSLRYHWPTYTIFTGGSTDHHTQRPLLETHCAVFFHSSGDISTQQGYLSHTDDLIYRVE